MAGNENKRTIPQFASYEEEAAFWDTHDLTDFWEETKPVTIQFRKNPVTSPISIRFDEKTLQDIRALAQDKGIGATTLVRMWALEKLQQERRASV